MRLRIGKIIVLIVTIALCSATHFAQQVLYPSLSESQLVFQGDSGKWDQNKVHTFSVVKANKDGYKYWGYYGLAYYRDNAVLRKAGLARSNDLIHWDKFEGNPIIPNDCRWPTVIYQNKVFYMFYAEYDTTYSSQIVMVTSKDGKNFQNKIVVVPRVNGVQNQNPFIYHDKKDKNYYLAYYNGTERHKDSTQRIWNLNIIKSKDLMKLKDAKPKTLMSSHDVLAAPSIAYYNKKYYLLAEASAKGKWSDKWVTLGYVSDKPDGDYKEVNNNNNPPIFYDNDACAFEYVLNKDLYIFYSHCLDLKKWDWELRMVKATK